jgi:hypothetical protein
MPVWYCKWFQFSAVAGAGSQPLVLTPFFDFGWINRSFFIVPTVRLPDPSSHRGSENVFGNL